MPLAMSPSPSRPAALSAHPPGLVVCFLTEMWERFSFYGMKALLFFYITKHHLFSDDEAYLLLGTYGGLAYALPVLGGLAADRWLGSRLAVILGGALLCAGHFAMAWEGVPATLIDGVRQQDTGALQVFYLALALIITGVGLLKPNISTLVGALYAQDDPRRDAPGSTWASISGHLPLRCCAAGWGRPGAGAGVSGWPVWAWRSDSSALSAGAGTLATSGFRRCR